MAGSVQGVRKESIKNYYISIAFDSEEFSIEEGFTDYAEIVSLRMQLKDEKSSFLDIEVFPSVNSDKGKTFYLAKSYLIGVVVNKLDIQDNVEG